MCIVCINIVCSEETKIGAGHFRGFISTCIPLDFQGEVPCSGKISVCLCALTVFLETVMKLSFGCHSGAPHKHNGKNLGFKFNLSSCFAFNQPLKAKKKIMMNIISTLWV